jgi:putative oxidoreductase
MERFLGRYSEALYAVLRVVAGLMFAVHGAQKVFGAFGGQKVPLASLFGLAGVIELVGGILIAIGLLTSWAAFIASGEMAVAYFKVHAPQGGLPHQNQGELAVLYCFVFLYMAARGGGRYSVDASMRQTAARR